MTLTDIFSHRSVQIALAPELLTAVVRSGTRIVAYTEIRIPVDYPQGHWQAALNTFSGYLRGAGLALAGAPVAVSVSTRWCQLAMLSWSEALLYEDSAQRHAEACFVGLYGEVARTWSVVCDDAPYGQPRLACALDRGFYDSLQQIAFERGHPCSVIESALSSTWRALATKERAAHDWSAADHTGAERAVVLIEPGRLVLAAAVNGHVTDVQTQALRGPWEQQLPPEWQPCTLCVPVLGEIAQVALVQAAPQIVLHAPSHAPAHALAQTPARIVLTALRHSPAARA